MVIGDVHMPMGWRQNADDTEQVNDKAAEKLPLYLTRCLSKALHSVP